MKKPTAEEVTRYADMFAAIGTESRLRILRELLSAYPDGMVVGEIQSELGMSASNLSHHLDKMKNEGLLTVTREGTFPAGLPLWGMLYAQSCTGSGSHRKSL